MLNKEAYERQIQYQRAVIYEEHVQGRETIHRFPRRTPLKREIKDKTFIND